MAQLGVTYLLCYSFDQKRRPATGVMNEKKDNLEDVSELHCDTKRLHSPNSFQFSVLKVSEPDGDRMSCADITVAGESTVCPKRLTGNLKLCKFRNVDLDSCVCTKEKKRQTEWYTGWDAKKPV